MSGGSFFFQPRRPPPDPCASCRLPARHAPESAPGGRSSSLSSSLLLPPPLLPLLLLLSYTGKGCRRPPAPPGGGSFPGPVADAPDTTPAALAAEASSIAHWGCSPTSTSSSSCEENTPYLQPGGTAAAAAGAGAAELAPQQSAPHNCQNTKRPPAKDSARSCPLQGRCSRRRAHRRPGRGRAGPGQVQALLTAGRHLA